jgi:hypothetical protein
LIAGLLSAVAPVLLRVDFDAGHAGVAGLSTRSQINSE